MKAWLLESPGGLSKITLGETSDPAPRTGEVILRVTYAALNPADRYLAEGMYPAKPAFPHILGRDGMGAPGTFMERENFYFVTLLGQGRRRRGARKPRSHDDYGTFSSIRRSDQFVFELAVTPLLFNGTGRNL